MKTKLTLFIFLFSAFVSLNAQQLQNGGFETWSIDTPSIPEHWDTYDHLVKVNGFPVKPWCIQDTTPANVYSGSSACRLMTDSTVAPIKKIPGAVANGTLGLAGNGMPYQKGWPMTSRPISLQGAIKYLPNGADTAIYQLFLTKWNVTGDSADLIGAVEIGVVSTGGIYLPFNDSIQYLSAATPDTILISFSSGLGSSSKVGTKLWVDDLSLVFPSTGIVHLDMDDAVKVFPNPAATSINISVDDYMKGFTFEIFDINGRLAKRTVLESAASTLNISELESGNYIYRLNDLQNRIIHQRKFTVSK